MKKFSSLLLIFLFSASFLSANDGAPHISKRRMLNDLEYIKNVFEIRYAPLAWKKKFAKWDLQREYSYAKARICTLSNPTLAEFHRILKDFLTTTKDYHVGIQFYATEAAYLPFNVKGSNGRYFVTYLDRCALPAREYPINIGDEILSFDNQPVGELIERIRKEELGSNSPHTDRELAEFSLTSRKAACAQDVPQGDVVLTYVPKGRSKPCYLKVQWQYTPEFICDFSRISPNRDFPFQCVYDFNQQNRVSHFFNRQMVLSGWKPQTEVGTSLICENHHSLGSRVSFLPDLGKIVWSSENDFPFNAYIFLSPRSYRVGYVRIPHYSGDVEEVQKFIEIISKFKSETDALIIDQLNNPGGSVFYLYGLLSTLTDTPLETPYHRITLTQEEVYTAYTLLSALNGMSTDEDARSVLGESLGGYEISKETVELINKYCEFIIDEWSKGKLFTDATYLFGVDQIRPHSQVAYSKPLLVLTSALNFSAGDFFPAIIQDNKRGLILGQQTAGAGGFVLDNAFPNQTAIEAFSFTGSLALRKNQEPIENLGVKPDILYELTPEDFQNDYIQYKRKILETIEMMISKKVESSYEINSI